MENNINDNLRSRLNEIKNGESVNDIISDTESKNNNDNNIMDEHIPDMSRIPVPDIEYLRQKVPGGVHDDGPLMTIDPVNGTLNGKKFVPEQEENIPPAEVINEPVNVNSNENVNSDPEPEKKLSAKERARLYKEKNSNIHYKEPDKPAPRNIEDPYNAIEDGLKSLDEDSARKSAELYRLAAQQERMRAQEEESKKLKEKGMIETNDIDDIIDNINESAAKKELDVQDEEDLSLLIQRMEEQKVYADVPQNKEVTGPASYIIENDEQFKVNVEEILKGNGMRIIKKNSRNKDAILNRFVNSGPHISMPLVNSGMFVTMSGAGTDEIIAMQQMENDNPVRMEINKLNHVCRHIVDSSVGSLKLSQLLDIVSYYDKDTLYYGLYAGSYPEESEFQRNCHRCGQQFFMTVRTRDLLLNPEDFEEDENDIKDNVTTLSRLVEKSKLGKIYKKVHSNGMIVYVKHPSVKSYLETLQSLTQDTMRLYPRLIDLAYSIDKIGIHVKDNEFMEFTDPNEIIEIISKFKDTAAKYEIFDMINEVRPNTLPTYGLKECKCPHCQAENPAQTYDMEDMIFMQAQRKEEMEAMRWAAKNQKRQKEEKNKSKRG